MQDMGSPAMSDEEYQAEDDCDTLCKAEEIKMDKKRLAAAMKVAGERNSAMKKMMDGNRPMSKGE